MRIVRVLIAFWTFTFSVFVGIGVASASAKNNKSAITLRQLESYISLSSRISRAPDLTATVPPLDSIVSDGLTLSMKYPCYSEDKAKLPSNPKLQCLWGDKKGKKSIFLFGDSQAASWLPAFNQIGLTEGYKVYFLAEASCPPWEHLGAKNFTLTTGLTFYQCTSIVAKETHFANTIHPALVVLAGDTNENGANQWNVTTADYSPEITGAVSRLKPSGSQIVLLSQVPQYYVTTTNPMTPTACLTVHGSNVIPCLLSPRDITASPLSQALVATSATLHKPLINVLPLFCTSQRCPLTVWTPDGVFLTHYDQYHISKFYLTFIAPALLQLLKASVNF
jgi:hypothetical protein